MANAVTLKTIGDWRKEIGVPLRDALAVSMDVMGRTGAEACRHALILMAQSAAALTIVAKKNRAIMKDEHGEYVENYRYVEGGRVSLRAQKLYRWMFSDKNPHERIPGTWENAKSISPRRRGLAKRSWMWGLGRLQRSARGMGMRKTSRSLPGTFKVWTISGKTVNGYVKENSLSYITHAMPAGWEPQVQIHVGNKIMGQARHKMEMQWKARMRRREKAAARRVQSFFVQGLSA